MRAAEEALSEVEGTATAPRLTSAPPPPPPPPPPPVVDLGDPRVPAAPDVIRLPEAEPQRLGAGFVRLWAAAAISNAGDGVRITALPLLAAAVTRDPIAVSGILLASNLPWLLFSLPAGAIVDRLERRRLVAGVSLLRAVVMALLCGLVFAGEATLPALYAVAFLQGLGEVFSDNAVFALVPEVAPRSRLEDANGRLEAVVHVTNQFAGPALGGFLFAYATGLPFLVDALSFLVMALLVAGIRRPVRQPVPPAEKKTIRADIAEGVRWLRARPALRNLSYIAALTNVALNATFAIFVLFALDELALSAAAFGILLSIEAFGALAGSLLAARIRKHVGIPLAITGALALAGVANLAISATAAIPVVSVMMVAVAFAGGVWNVLTNSLRQAVTPDRLMGRVQSAHRLLSWGAIPFGTLLGGLAASAFGLRAPFLIAACMLCALAVGAFTNSKHLQPDHMAAAAR
ncbi:MAG TPA: MFS transporter [Actinomycetota bacterium]|nr:MFS transporter [Actinomycetota bacterium]